MNMERRNSALGGFSSEAVASPEGDEGQQPTPKTRRPTVIKADDNPFIKKEAGSPDMSHKKIETLTSCRRITHAELLDLIDVLEHIQDNPSRLTLLEHQKQPFLFTSADLLELVTITESVKTRIVMIESVSPRLTDPTARVNDFLNLFRYIEEKNHVEEALKARAHQLNATQFSAGPANKLMSGGRGGRGGGMASPGGPLSGGGRGGRGGRGGGGASAAVADSTPPPVDSAPSTPIISSSKKIEEEIPPTPPAEPEREPEPEPEPEPKAEPEPEPEAVPAPPVESPRMSVRPSFRLSTVGGDDNVDAIPSAAEDYRESEARQFIMTPDSADPSALQDEVPAADPATAPRASPNTVQQQQQSGRDGTPSPGTLQRRMSLRQSLSDPSEREKHSERLSERLSKVEIAVVLAALNMPEREVREKETHLEEWEMAVVDCMDEEAEERASMSPGSSGGGIMRRLSNIIFGASVDDSAVGGDGGSSKASTGRRTSVTRRSSTTRASESDATNYAVFGSTRSEPESVQYGLSHVDGGRERPYSFQGSSSSGSRDGNEMPTPQRRASALIFSPSRPSPSKPAGWFSFKGVTNMFSPPKPERNSQDYKYASALAYSLNMDRAAFLAMEPETSIEDDEEGNPLYSYKELLRRQYTKMYLGLPIECLERFLVDDEFNFHFGMSKEKFYAQPKWKQISQKKALMLF